MKYELEHYEFDVLKDDNFYILFTIDKKLVETNKPNFYLLIDMIFGFALILLTLKATTERAFSAMKIIKIILYNKIKNYFCKI